MANVKVTLDRTKEAIAAVRAMSGSEVVVGVPASKNHRSDGPFGNADILWIAEFGSEAKPPYHRAIPPRPVLGPAMRKVRDDVARLLKYAAKRAIADGVTEVIPLYLDAIGVLARDACVGIIDAGDFTPLAEATIERRMRMAKNNPARGEFLLAAMRSGRLSAKRQNELALEARKAGKSVANYLAPPLFWTGVFRRSLSYEVRAANGAH